MSRMTTSVCHPLKGILQNVCPLPPLKWKAIKADLCRLGKVRSLSLAINCWMVTLARWNAASSIANGLC